MAELIAAGLQGLEVYHGSFDAPTVEALKVKRDAVSSKSLIDFGLWGAVRPDTAKHLDGFREAGVALFKGFMYDPPVKEMNRV